MKTITMRVRRVVTEDALVEICVPDGVCFARYLSLSDAVSRDEVADALNDADWKHRQIDYIVDSVKVS